MKNFLNFLKIGSPVFIFVGLLHLGLGPAAEVLLGANLPPEVIADSVLDSQNRFYGVTFSVYGFLLYLCATDMERYSPVFYICIWVFFAGGVARLISIAFTGVPSLTVLVLLVTELLLPPLLTVWYGNVRTES